MKRTSALAMTAALVCSLMATRPAMATPNLLYPVNGGAFVHTSVPFVGVYETGELRNFNIGAFGAEAGIGKSSSGTYAVTIYFVGDGNFATFTLLGNRTDGSGVVGRSSQVSIGGSGVKAITISVNAGAGEFFWLVQVIVPSATVLGPFRLIGVRPTT